ncbi:hypothetical protein AFLA_001010 [Aspergillus flavus NRRL3357]|nr:hypothetical protein AFLA_001010 [Aspergillus flavus NRRL3357]
MPGLATCITVQLRRYKVIHSKLQIRNPRRESWSSYTIRTDTSMHFDIFLIFDLFSPLRSGLKIRKEIPWSFKEGCPSYQYLG